MNIQGNAFFQQIAKGNEDRYLYTYRGLESRASQVAEFNIESTENSGVYSTILDGKGDILEQVYLHLIIKNTNSYNLIEYTNFYNLIDNIKLYIQGKVIEEYGSETLKLMSLYKEKMYKIEKEDTVEVIFPLNLCISGNKNHGYGAKINFKLNDDDRIVDRKVYAKYTFLHSTERNLFFRKEIQLWKKNEIHYSFTVENNPYCINLKFLLGPIREIVLSVVQLDNFGEESMNSIDLELNGILTKHNTEFTKYVTPSELYGINTHNTYKLRSECGYGSKRSLYFIPFDQTPRSDVCTGTLNFNRIDRGKIYLNLNPGKYSVTLMSREFSLLNTLLFRN